MNRFDQLTPADLERRPQEVPAVGPGFWRGLRNVIILYIIAGIVGALLALWLTP